jgi:hypothetical protein
VTKIPIVLLAVSLMRLSLSASGGDCSHLTDGRLVGKPELLDSRVLSDQAEVRLFRGEFAMSTDPNRTKSGYWVEVEPAGQDVAYQVTSWGPISGESDHPICGAVIEMSDDRHGAASWDQWPFLFLDTFTLPDDLNDLREWEISPRFTSAKRSGRCPMCAILDRRPVEGMLPVPRVERDMLVLRDVLEDAGVDEIRVMPRPISSICVTGLRWRNTAKHWEVKLGVRPGPPSDETEISLFRMGYEHRWLVRAAAAPSPPIEHDPTTRLPLCPNWGSRLYCLVTGALMGLMIAVLGAALAHRFRTTGGKSSEGNGREGPGGNS